MNLTCIVFGMLFSAIGILFAAGKLHSHLSSWKSMTAKEREKVNIVPLCRNIGGVILLSGIIFLLKGFCPAFGGRLFTGALIAWFLIAAFDLWFISKSKRYNKN